MILMKTTKAIKNTSYIQKLIAELCLNGVKYRKLCECLQRTKDTSITAQKTAKIHKNEVPINPIALQPFVVSSTSSTSLRKPLSPNGLHL